MERFPRRASLSGPEEQWGQISFRGVWEAWLWPSCLGPRQPCITGSQAGTKTQTEAGGHSLHTLVPGGVAFLSFTVTWPWRQRGWQEVNSRFRKQNAWISNQKTKGVGGGIAGSHSVLGDCRRGSLIKLCVNSWMHPELLVHA